MIEILSEGVLQKKKEKRKIYRGRQKKLQNEKKKERKMRAGVEMRKKGMASLNMIVTREKERRKRE